MDFNKRALNHPDKPFDYDNFQHSQDHKIVGWAEDIDGAGFCTTYLWDLETKQYMGEPIKDARSFVITPCGRFVVFVRRPRDIGRDRDVYIRPIGGSEQNEELKWSEKDDGSFVFVYTLKSKDYIAIFTYMPGTNETWLLPTYNLGAKPWCFAPRKPCVQYDVQSLTNGQFLVRTNEDAINFKVVTASKSDGSPDQPTVKIDHDDDTYIVDVDVFEDYIARHIKNDGRDQIIVENRHNGREVYIKTPEEKAYSLELGNYRLEYTSKVIRYTSSTLTHEYRVIEFDPESGEYYILRDVNTPTVDESNYRTEVYLVDCPSGTKTPMALLWHKDAPPSSERAVLTRLYGWYGHVFPNTFRHVWLSWVDRGNTLALLPLPGGSDMGPSHWKSACGLNGMVRVDSLKACISYITDEGLGNPNEIYAHGASAAGATISTAIYRYPGLLAGAMVDNGSVNVVQHMCDVEWFNTEANWMEYCGGDPTKNRIALNMAKSLSGRLNLERGPLPAVLANTAVSDDRVPFYIPVEWILDIRDCSENNKPALVYIEDAGHFGQSDRDGQARDLAKNISFLLQCAGMDKAELL